MAARVPLYAIFNAQDNMTRKMRTMGNNMENCIGGALKKIGAIAATAFSAKIIADFATDAMKTFVTFQKDMTEVFSLMPDITQAEMGKMQQQALNLATDMGTLPEEVVPALYQALSAGVPKDNVFSFLETANKAAIGGVTTLETAVDGLTSVVNAYGANNLSVQQASDLMFQTVKLGKTTFDELAASLYNVVPTAVGAGVAFSDISAALAAMTAQGIPTSVATTELRQAIVELSKSGTATDKIFQKVSGKTFKDFIKGGGNLQDAFQLLEVHAHDTGKGVNDMFSSVEAGNAVLALTGQGTKMFTDDMAAMANAAGSTDAAFGTMEDSMSRKLDKLKASWEVAKIGIGEVLLDALLPIFEYVSAHIDDITGFLRGAFALLGNALSTFWSIAEPIIGWIQANPELLVTFLMGIGAAIITYKVASGIEGVAASIKALSLAVTASPIGILTALVGLVVAIGTAVNEAAKKAEEKNLAEHFGKITLSAEELKDVASRIVRTKAIEKLGKALSALDVAKSISEEMEQASDVIDKLNWKVGIGIELTDEDQQDYITAVEQFVQKAQQTIEQNQYSVNLALDVFGYAGDAGIRDTLNGFYSRNQQKVAELGTKLKNTVNAAWEDGLLTIDEVKKIQEIQQQIAEITAKISQDNYEAKLDVLTLNYSGAQLTPETFATLQTDLQEELKNRLSEIDTAGALVVSNLKAVIADPESTAAEIEKAKQDLAAFAEKHLIAKVQATLQVEKVNLNTISDTYGPEASTAFGNLQSTLQNMFQDQLANMDLKNPFFDVNVIANKLMENNKQLSPEVKANLQKIWDQMQPNVEQMNTLAAQYRAEGKKLPENLVQGMMDAASLGALVGDENSIYTLIGAMFAESDPKYQEILTNLKSQGSNIPQSVVDGMEANKSLLETTGADLLNTLKARLEQGTSATIPVTATVNMTTTYRYNAQDTDQNSKSDYIYYEGFASGTTNAPDAYIAGEEGPELIVGKAGSTVFPTRETDKIISSVGGSRTVNLNIKGSGSIAVKGGNKEEAWNEAKPYIKKVFLEILDEETFEEGDGTYDY